jgi:hypothetical protein
MVDLSLPVFGVGTASTGEAVDVSLVEGPEALSPRAIEGLVDVLPHMYFVEDARPVGLRRTGPRRVDLLRRRSNADRQS